MRNAKTARTIPTDIRPIGALRTRKVIEEFAPLSYSPSGGETFGQQVDAAILSAALNGDRIQELAVMFEDEHWFAIAAEINNSRNGYSSEQVYD